MSVLIFYKSAMRILTKKNRFVKLLQSQTGEINCS